MSDQPLWNSAKGSDMSDLTGVFMVHLLNFIHGCRNRWGERDVVWEHGENLFPGFKYKYCVKEFYGSRVTRLKEHLAEKSGNGARCTKCPSDIRDYFLRELHLKE
jgi:hypothetical protein